MYERLFWLLQITFTFEAAIACVMYQLRDKKGWIMAGIIVGGMLISGCRFRYYNARFEIKENLEGISNTTKQLADAVLEKGEENNRLMLPQPYIFEVRQYTGGIELAWSLYIKFILPENAEDGYVERLNNLYNVLYNGGNINDDIWGELEYFDIQYVGVRTGDLSVFEKCPMIYEDSNLIIYDLTGRKEQSKVYGF